jgi:threonylcarbamoyladenosine tRNA methylthiotransferase MtaB
VSGLDVITFGCRLNAYESDVVRARATDAGLTDAVVFNTCAVTGEAVRQARQAIRKARRERPGARLIVTGCAAQIDPGSFADMAEVDLVLGNAEKTQASAYAEAPPTARINVADIFSVHESEAPPTARINVADIFSVHESEAPVVTDRNGRARAYVEIQNGCDHRCTFCIIPYGRGNSRSVGAGAVVEAVRRLAAEGCAEVVLTGVDLTSWGADLPGAPSLGHLVRRILRLVPGLPRLRLSSIDAAEIDAELLACLAEEPRLAPHLHLSLQAGDDMILKRMKRRHSRAQSLALIAKVRAVRPETAFGADLIAGFPTETDAMFENTLRLVEEAGLAYLHVFPFSPRPGTPAARMPAVERATVKARAERLRGAGAAGLNRHLAAKVGRTVQGLVERAGLARADDFTEIAFDGEAMAGRIVPLTVTAHDGARAIGALA